MVETRTFLGIYIGESNQKPGLLITVLRYDHANLAGSEQEMRD